MVETPDQFRKRLELQDYGHELAGLDTGRMTRFRVGEGNSGNIREKERKERAYRDALARLLAEDPEYRALYLDLGNRLREAEMEADTAIAAIEEALATIQLENADMRSQAPNVDGRAVFRYSDGRVVNQDGTEIDPLIAEGIIWPEDASSAEDYLASMDREAELAQAFVDWDTYRNETLGEVRHRHDDRESPFEDANSLNDALARIESARPTAFSLEGATGPEQSSADVTPGAFPTIAPNQ